VGVNTSHSSPLERSIWQVFFVVLDAMCPLQMPLKKVLTDKGSSAQGTLVALKRSVATVAHFMTFALVFAVKPRCTGKGFNNPL
jgi:hypothetical protein